MCSFKFTWSWVTSDSIWTRLIHARVIVYQLIHDNIRYLEITRANAQDNGENIPAAFSRQKTVLSIEKTRVAVSKFAAPRKKIQAQVAPSRLFRSCCVSLYKYTEKADESRIQSDTNPRIDYNQNKKNDIYKNEKS